MSSPSHPSTGDGLEAVRENRETLETLAKSDLRSAKWARALLNAADEEGST